MSKAIAAFNQLRLTLSNDFQSRIPQASQDNFKEIGIMLLDLPENRGAMNEWLNGILNKIGLTLIRTAEARNRLAQFKTGTMEYGDIIEEIGINIPVMETYLDGERNVEDVDPCAPNPFCKVAQEHQVNYHKKNRKEFVQRTIWPDLLRRAFRGPDGYFTLINAITESMVTANTNAEYLWTKEVFSTYLTQTVKPLTANQIITMDSPVDSTTGKDFLRMLKYTADMLTFNSETFNPNGIMQYTDPSDMILFINPAVTAYIDTDVLAAAFNPRYLDYPHQIIKLDDFGTDTWRADGGDPTTITGEGFYAALVDRRFFMIYDDVRRFETIWNPKGLYWNYWYHVWQLYAASFYRNAVFFRSPVVPTP